MIGESRQAPLGALTVSVQWTAEVAHNFTQSLLSKNCMWCSTFTTVT